MKIEFVNLLVGTHECCACSTTVSFVDIRVFCWIDFKRNGFPIFSTGAHQMIIYEIELVIRIIAAPGVFGKPIESNLCGQAHDALQQSQ